MTLDNAQNPLSGAQNPLLAFSDALQDLVRRTAPSVVSLTHGRGQGSGIVIAEDGYVVTNSHVVRGAQKLAAGVDAGDRVPAEVVGDDPASDLAVVRLASGRLTSLPLVEQRRLSVGQLVIAIGNPLRFDRSVSFGVVSAIDRSLPGPRGRAFEGLVQTDAAINPGSSGGPLLDASGAVVGINTAIVPHARGIGFAIPSHTASWVVAVLLRRGRVERPYLGLAAPGLELSAARAGELGQSRAVRVLEVATDGPAARAGLRPGDFVLTAQGAPVLSVDDLVRCMVLGTGELVLGVARGPQRLELRAVPGPERHAA